MTANATAVQYPIRLHGGLTMEVTAATWIIALVGLGLITLLCGLQLVAVLRPRDAWTVENVYGGSPDRPAFGVVEGGYCFVRLLEGSGAQ